MRKSSILPAASAILMACVVNFAAAAPPSAATLKRGRYLMDGVVACANCHMARGAQGEYLADKGLSGGMPFDDKMFKSYAANITQDRETGVGKWTDAQLVKAIREGVRPDGSVIGPPMPIEFYRHMSDAGRERDRRRAAHRTGSPQRRPEKRIQLPAASQLGPAGHEGQAAFARRQGQIRRIPGEHRPLHGMPYPARPEGDAADDQPRLGRPRVPWPVGRERVAQPHAA